ncbi:MAG: citramalate synthase [Candidatus Dormibacterales bacterium]
MQADQASREAGAGDGRVVVYDTTLRDGAQGIGISFSLDDKVRIATVLDGAGFDYLEGGFPGSNPKDAEFFDRLRRRPLEKARLAAFGATRRAGVTCEEDENLAALAATGAPAWTLVGKSDPWQVAEVLRTTGSENLAMVAESVAHGVGLGREVVFDAEHFFDGFARDRAYALEVCARAGAAGAAWVVLCDTNGGSLPSRVAAGVEAVRARLAADAPGARLGIHAHNDCELAVANTLAAVEAGAAMVQGTVNGYGERCGNVNLCSVVPNLALKMGRRALESSSLSRLTELSRTVAEIANVATSPQQPFVGAAAFAHKGGQHAAAMLRHQDSYQHIDPGLVGNRRRVLVSELSGKGSVIHKAREYGLELDGDPELIRALVARVKDLEKQGYSYEGADASFEMLLRRARPGYRPPWEVLDFMSVVRRDGDRGLRSEAMVKVRVGGRTVHTAAEGNGPVNALDAALRKALGASRPGLRRVRLLDYKVRVLDGRAGTAATTRVLVDSGDGEERWTTVGCSANIIEASLAALLDSLEYAERRARPAAVQGRPAPTPSKPARPPTTRARPA